LLASKYSAYRADISGSFRGQKMVGNVRVWNKVTTNFKERHTVERSIVGSWSIKSGMVTVKTPNGEKTAQIGGATPESLARILLVELAREGKA
jgi:hypothetical protein